MPQDHDHPPPAASTPAPTAADFDEAFSAVASTGIRRVWELAAPDLPPQIEPFSFVSADLLRHMAQTLDLSPGQTLVDLGCGRGGPGMWLAREADVSLVGVDFSPVGVEQAAHRAALLGLAGRARFVVGDLTHTGLPQASADAAVSIDAFHFASDPAAAAREARRILRPSPAARPDQLAAEGPGRCPGAGQNAHRLAPGTAQRRLRRHRDADPARVARPVDPRVPGRPRPRRSRRRHPARRPARRGPAPPSPGGPHRPGRRHRNGTRPAARSRSTAGALTGLPGLSVGHQGQSHQQGNAIRDDQRHVPRPLSRRKSKSGRPSTATERAPVSLSVAVLPLGRSHPGSSP